MQCMILGQLTLKRFLMVSMLSSVRPSLRPRSRASITASGQSKYRTKAGSCMDGVCKSSRLLPSPWNAKVMLECSKSLCRGSHLASVSLEGCAVLLVPREAVDEEAVLAALRHRRLEQPVRHLPVRQL